MEPDDDWTDVIGEFSSHVSMEEGVSGRKLIDTTYENTSVSTIQHPKSENRDERAIHDVKRGRYPHREY
jgi:hypothetical protein